MCGRYTMRTPLTLLIEQFNARPELVQTTFLPRYNIAPTQSILAVRAGSDEERVISELHWGLIPAWSKEPRGTTINARAETIAEKPMFRSAFRSRRCLILTDGYYEWARIGSKKQPYLFEIGQRPFAFAGIWESWRGEGQTPLQSCAIITTSANALASTIHDRMPVILHPTDYDAWLDPGNKDAAELARLLVPWESDDLTMRPVSTFVNNARNEGPQCVEPTSIEQG
ncbi:MAG: SOS response-associated peptidase [Planctomycetota bacterium]|nr:SOS response-associated peptidase [Planctomycetota bacterium]